MILVTGGTGLVGSHLLYQLTSQNKEVRAIYRTSNSLHAVKKVFSYYTSAADDLFSRIDWVKADITDVPSLESVFVDIDTVYHAAALVSFDSKDDLEMRQVNIDGTANIVNYAIAGNVKKLCFVSSIATIGDPINAKIVTEENEWAIAVESSGYAITKHGAEMEVWRASQEGIDVIIVNPGVILGAGFWQVNTGLLFAKAAKGFAFFTEGVTGFVGVTDVASAMLKLMASDVKNERFILVAENTSFKLLFSQIAHYFEQKPPTIQISKRMTSLLRRIDGTVSFFTGKKRMITKDSEHSLHSKTYYSSEKIKQRIGFEFTPLKSIVKVVCARYK